MVTGIYGKEFVGMTPADKKEQLKPWAIMAARSKRSGFNDCEPVGYSLENHIYLGGEMMKKLGILYATMTGHSRTISEAIGKALEVQALNVSDRPVFADVDLLFIVGGIYSGTSLPSLSKFVKTLTSDRAKKVALVTSAARGQKQNTIRNILQKNGIEVLDEFACPGSFLFLSRGHPNEQDIQNAVDFAVKISGKEPQN
ncbi:MAG: hypothetical protein GX883_06645 [Firmicutes bacterium]|nr:hypothetical protein [Bacillota bacterium]